jgi:hypothetical protein
VGAASGVSEPILFSVTVPRTASLLILLVCVAAALLLADLFFGGRLFPLGVRPPAARWMVLVGLVGTCFGAVLAAAQLASPPVLLKATERGLTTFMTRGRPGGGTRLQLARHSDTGGVFIPWRAMDSLALERVSVHQGDLVEPREVIAITLRPGFEGLREQVAPVTAGERRSTLDLPVPVPPGGEALVAELRALRDRFAGH